MQYAYTVHSQVGCIVEHESLSNKMLEIGPLRSIVCSYFHRVKTLEQVPVKVEEERIRKMHAEKEETLI